MADKKVLFNYNGVKVFAESDAATKLWILCPGSVIGPGPKLFERWFKNASDAKPLVDLYIQTAQWFGEVLETGWVLRTRWSRSPFLDRRYIASACFCIPETSHEIYVNRRLFKGHLTHKKLKALKRKTPTQNGSEIVQNEKNELECLTEASNKKRNQLAIEHVTKSMSDLSTEDALKVIEQFNLSRPEADLAQLTTN